MQPTEYRHAGGWSRKFANAFRGVAHGIRGQNSFVVHVTMTALVLLTGAVLSLSRFEWCLIVLCIAAVVTAELFNSSLETMAKTIDRAENQELGKSLDIASGAVLIAALGAATVGAIVFGTNLWMLLSQ